MAKRTQTRSVAPAPVAPAAPPQTTAEPTAESQDESVFAELHIAVENKDDRGPIKSVEMTSTGTRRIEYYRPSEW